MTIAAQQLRVHLLATFPGIRIGRKSCRDTAGGDISQHSAYAFSYDSNALDLYGPEELPLAEERAFVDTVVAYLDPYWFEWSIRKVLWRTTDHFGHAHVDFYPMCATRKWCQTPTATPTWRYSNGSTIQSRDPEPENGRYEGDDMFPKWIIEGWVEDKPGTEKRFLRLFNEDGKPATPETDYWMAKLDNPSDPEWPGFVARRQLEFWAQSSEESSP